MKFNFSLKGRQSAETRYAFVKAGMPDVPEELYRSLLVASFNDDPSAPLTTEGVAVRKEIRSGDREVIVRIALHLGEEKNFREAAFWLTAELAAVYGNQESIGLVIERVVRQATDIPRWLAWFTRAAGPGARPGRAVRKALDQLFNRLDEYSVSRCSREARMALKEAMQFLRPKGADKARKALFGKILRDQIPVRSTWEQEWHALYQQHYDSPEQRQVSLRDKWKEGISSFRIGYPALLDNLRPMLCAGVSGKVLKLAAEYLGNPAAVAKSDISPLRLLEAYQALRRMEQGGAGMLVEALEGAVLHSRWANTAFGSQGVSVIAMDVSNSMKQPVYPGGGGAQPVYPGGGGAQPVYPGGRGAQPGYPGRDSTLPIYPGRGIGTQPACPGDGAQPVNPDEGASSVRPGSGAQPAHAEGVAQRFDVAPLLAWLWLNKGYSVLPGIIGNTWKPLDLAARPVLTAVEQFRAREGEAGYGLNAHLILDQLLRRRKVVDRVLIFTDTRLWANRGFNQPAGTDLGGWWRQYKRQVAPRARLYLFDLAGYGFPALECLEDDVFLVAGWKEGVLEALEALEKGRE